MKIESTAILYLGVMFFLAILFCKTLEIIIERVRKLLANRSDYIDPVKMELNALGIKINALRIKVDGKFDVLKTEINALKTEIDALKSKAELVATEQFSVVSTSPTPILEDAYSNGDDTWTRDMRGPENSIVPIVPRTASEDTWTRDTADNLPEGRANAEKKSHLVQVTNPPSLQPRILSPARQWELPQVLID